MSNGPRRATPDETRAFASRAVANGGAAESSYRTVDGLSVSSIGLGTYLGDADDAVDLLYTEAIVEAVRIGCNVVDSAVNYRFQRSERAIGVALERLARSGDAAREALVVTTKGGFVPFDGAPPGSRERAKAYVERTFFANGVCTPAEMTANLQHCMAPAYLDNQLATSLANLGLDAVDVYYIHNPETQLAEIDRAEFERRIRAAFELLEAKAAEGRIGRYGTATWNGFRADSSAAEHLSLERLVAIAREVGGPDHHFRAIQLPFNLAMPEAYASFNQRVGADAVSTLEAARRLEVSVFASASLYQSRLASDLPVEVTSAFPVGGGARPALQFVRSTPGVACALVGMAHTAHVRENVGLLGTAPASPDEVRGLFEEDD